MENQRKNKIQRIKSFIFSRKGLAILALCFALSEAGIVNLSLYSHEAQCLSSCYTVNRYSDYFIPFELKGPDNSFTRAISSALEEHPKFISSAGENVIKLEILETNDAAERFIPLMRKGKLFARLKLAGFTDGEYFLKYEFKYLGFANSKIVLRDFGRQIAKDLAGGVSK